MVKENCWDRDFEDFRRRETVSSEDHPKILLPVAYISLGLVLLPCQDQEVLSIFLSLLPLKGDFSAALFVSAGMCVCLDVAPVG